MELGGGERVGGFDGAEGSGEEGVGDPLYIREMSGSVRKGG